MLLAIVIVALGLRWYLEHNDPRRTELVGTWKCPFDSYSPVGWGYTTELKIHGDGTFEKIAILRLHREIYSGTYHFEKDCVLTFHATKKTTLNDLLPGLNKMYRERNEPELTDDPPVEIDATYSIMAAVDKSRHLLLECLREKRDLVPKGPMEFNLRWEHAYERIK